MIPGFLLPASKRWLGYWRLMRARKNGICDYRPTSRHGKIRVLFYDKQGLGYAGTQKSLQILAKFLDKEKFEVFFLYSSRLATQRLAYFEGEHVELIDFDFMGIEKKIPYTISGMRPHIFEVLKERSIDVLVAAGSGYPEFPIAQISAVPIVYINVFGSINPQRNIVRYLCISPYLQRLVAPALPGRSVETFYIPSEHPPKESQGWGQELRARLGVPAEAIVFGRIGRPDDGIFDPIGLLAFEQVVKKYPHVYYLIVTPPPAARLLVAERSIPHVVFFEGSGAEKDVWSFHFAIDVMAHFRKDGETQGVNITESMLAGRPIVTHKSPIWNAHIEYLEPDFAYIAEVGDVESYARYLMLFAADADREKIHSMGARARAKALTMVSVDKQVAVFSTYLTEAVKGHI